MRGSVTSIGRVSKMEHGKESGAELEAIEFEVRRKICKVEAQLTRL